MGIAEVISNPTLVPAIFLDRDGVINRNVVDPTTGEYGAPLRAEDFELTPGALQALQLLREAGFSLFLVSNQPNYAKGKSSLEELGAIHAKLLEELHAADIEFTDFYYCYHHPQGVISTHSGPCDCRKPSPYFLLKARDTHGINLESSWMIGDRPADIECGRAAGVRTICVREDHPGNRAIDDVRADFDADDLAAAAQIILRNPHYEQAQK